MHVSAEAIYQSLYVQSHAASTLAGQGSHEFFCGSESMVRRRKSACIRRKD
jgi:hypothetical protein